jgi:hypothetical protein
MFKRVLDMPYWVAVNTITVRYVVSADVKVDNSVLTVHTVLVGLTVYHWYINHFRKISLSAVAYDGRCYVAETGCPPCNHNRKYLSLSLVALSPRLH